MGVARLLLLAAVVIWGWTFVATKICLVYLEPIELLGLRLSIALPVLLSIARFQGVRLDFRSRAPSIALGATLITIHFLIQITGLQYTTATNTGWIIAVTPLVLAVLAALLLRERLSRRMVYGIAISTLGIALLVSKGNLASLGWLESPGDWLVLGSAHTWALYTIAIRNLARSQPPLAVTIEVFLPAAIVVLAIMAATTGVSHLARLPGEGWIALLFLAIPGMALAQWFWQVGVARMGAARAGLFLYIEPLATTSLAVPYLGEKATPHTLVGGGLVLLGVWLSQRRRTG